VPYNYIGATAFSLTQIFGYTSPKLAVWQPTSFAYALTPTPPANSLVAGQGYWVRFPHSVGLLLAGTPLSNTTGTTASISLQAGWNMIGEPFETNIPISSLMFTDSTGNQYTYAQASSPQVQLIDPSLYYYDSNAGQYAVSGSSDTLTEWYGYWIQAMAPCTMIVTHP
jgi:hypothetical protein